MSERETRVDESTPDKQPYEKPAIVYHEKVEARAATCNPPSKSDQPACTPPLAS
jgi:hypothetical protein